MPELQTPGTFDWTRYPWGPALRCLPLAAVADHCFTTRQPAIPDGDGGPGDAWQRMAFAFGVPRAAILRVRQVHGAEVLAIGRQRAVPAEFSEAGRADALVSDHPGVVLAVRVADCVPLLLADRRTGAVAAVHAGWRGAVAGVVAAAVRALGAEFGARPEDLVAAIGPSIGACCYRVGAEVRDAFAAVAPDPAALERWLLREPPRPALKGVPGTGPAAGDGRPPSWLDMWGVVADQLAQTGVSPASVHAARVCTSCHRDRFHSYRVDGPGGGRMVGVIRRKP